MVGRNRARTVLGGLALAIGVATAGPAVGASPRPAASPVASPVAVSEGLRVEASTTYTIDPAGGAVHVAVDLTLTNQLRDQAVAGGVRQFYFDRFSVPVLAEATALTASKAGGGGLPVRLEGADTPRFSFAVIDLQPDLYHPATQTIRLTYDIPRVPARSEALSRVNEAYVTFPAVATGDPDLATVEVIAPEALEVELVGDTMDESTRDGRQVFTASSIGDPSQWSVWVSARDDDKLVSRSVDLGEHDVEVLGWPDDAKWADFAAQHVTDGVPVLEALIGIEWPATSTIDVVETSSPYLYGYAGWYRPSEAVIEVGDELDAHVILHELAHLWFNHQIFEGRWVNEAFADQLAAMTLAELGREAREPEPVDPDDPGRLALNEWGDPYVQSELAQDQERYGYNTAWTVLHEVVDEVGAEGLTEVILAADQGRVAYSGPGMPAELRRSFDWHELLDLLEEVGGSTTAVELFERYVVGADDTADFEARTAARARHADLVAAGEGWASPAGVRLALTDWRFPTAEQMIDRANDVLAVKADLVEVAADLEVDDRLALQTSYEESRNVDADLQEEAEGALDAARALQAAEDAVDDGAGPLGAVGLLITPADDGLDDAQRAFEAGDYERVVSASADVEDTLDRAGTLGAAAVGAAVLVLVSSFLSARAIRRRRARRRAAASEADGAEGVGGAPDDASEARV